MVGVLIYSALSTGTSHMRVGDIARGQTGRTARNRDGAGPPRNDATMTVSLPRKLAAMVEADARGKGMTRNSFLRAMIRGYFGSACQPHFDAHALTPEQQKSLGL